MKDTRQTILVVIFATMAGLRLLDHPPAWPPRPLTIIVSVLVVAGVIGLTVNLIRARNTREKAPRR